MSVLWNLVNPQNFNPVGAFTQGQQAREQIDTRNARRSVLQQLAGTDNGTPNFSTGATQLARAGDLEGAGALARLAQLNTRDVPSSVREYEYGLKNPGFNEYQLGLKRAGRTNVSVNNKMETEYDKQTGKEFAQQNIDIIKSAQNARGKIATLDRLDQLLSDPSIYTGAGANLVTDAKRLAKAIGIDVGDVGGAEAVRAISNQFALELRNPAGGAGMPGALSDKDREFLQASVPGLQQSPEGNRRILDFMRRVAQRSIEVERFRGDYVRRNGRLDEGFYRALGEWSAQNPLFPEADRVGIGAPAGGQAAPAPQGAPPRIGTQQEYNALPSGSPFIAPDGTVRRKP